jgi:Ca-activated chloride channel homolog
MIAVARTLVATVALAALGSLVPAQQLPSFRSGVDVVSLSVTVTEPSGRYVTDLTSEQFRVYEDGIEQDIAYFNRTNVPIALALLLDTSVSMQDKMATAQQAAVGFARRLRPQDLAELVGFSSRTEVLQGFTNDQSALETAIRKTAAAGSTSLYTAVYVSLKELTKIRAATDQPIRRQAIVVFTDGEDTSSLVGYDELLDLARRSETVIYAIGLRPPAEVVARTYSATDFALRQLAQETGGRVFFPSRIEDLAGVYEQIADELASQYVVGYVPKSTKRDGGWRRVIVRVDREGASARTRLGYFGPKQKQTASGS